MRYLNLAREIIDRVDQAADCRTRALAAHRAGDHADHARLMRHADQHDQYALQAGITWAERVVSLEHERVA